MFLPALPIAFAMLLAADVPDKPAARADQAKPDIALELSAAGTKVVRGEFPAFTVRLVNRGKVAVTLVKPGDGSECGWRTPIITWSVAPAQPKARYGRCGNMNPLRPDEIFELKPGERVKLSEWVGGPQMPLGPGKYQITVRYRNDPTMDWSKKGLGGHDPVAVKFAGRSTALDIESNAVEIVVGD